MLILLVSTLTMCCQVIPPFLFLLFYLCDVATLVFTKCLQPFSFFTIVSWSRPQLLPSFILTVSTACNSFPDSIEAKDKL